LEERMLEVREGRNRRPNALRFTCAGRYRPLGLPRAGVRWNRWLAPVPTAFLAASLDNPEVPRPDELLTLDGNDDRQVSLFRHVANVEGKVLK